MPFRSLTLPPNVSGQLLLSAMPARLEPWDAFVAQARLAGVTLTVCLNPLDEVRSVSPSYYSAIVGNQLPFRWLHLPMRNFGLAEQAGTFRSSVDQVIQALQAGDTVLLHCAAGMGRTGSTAACVLKGLGVPRDQALADVRAAGSNPESAMQSGLVDRF